MRAQGIFLNDVYQEGVGYYELCHAFAFGIARIYKMC